MNKLKTVLQSAKNLFIPSNLKENPLHQQRSVFEEQLKSYLTQNETKNITNDIQKTVNSLYNAEVINMKEMVEKMNDPKSNEEIERMKEVMEKSREEELKINSNFFNDFSLKILKNTNNSHLLDLALKSFAGSVDIPKDIDRSFVILELAKTKITSFSEKEDLDFYTSYFNKMKAQMEKNSDLYTKAGATLYVMQNPKGKFIYARDLYNFMKHNPDKLNADDSRMYQHIFEIFQNVADNSTIYESYYYLGEMYLNGDYVVQNFQKAFRYLCVSASYNHALSFYKLYTLLKEHKIRKSEAIYSPLDHSLTDKGQYREDEKALLFKYLRRAAEEGYVEAQFELANNLMSGDICKIDYKLALAWHRQACRNGYVLSYEPCGDLLYLGGSNLKKDKVLSLVMYYTAYSKGLFSLKDKVLKLRDELIKEGEPLPEMILI